jgi:hypothetical protein
MVAVAVGLPVGAEYFVHLILIFQARIEVRIPI